MAELSTFLGCWVCDARAARAPKRFYFDGFFGARARRGPKGEKNLTAQWWEIWKSMEKYGKVRNGGNVIGLTWWKQVISVKFTPYQVWRGMCMHPGSRLTTRQFIANSLLLCVFKTLCYSGFTGWGTPFYTQIYGALGGHPSAFHIGKPIL